MHAAEEVVDAEVGHQHGQEGDDEVGVQHCGALSVGQGTVLCPTQIIAETAQKRVLFMSIEEILLSFTCNYDINFVSLPAYLTY